MINIKIVCVGNLKEKFWIDSAEEYKKRLSRFCSLKIVEVAEQNKYDDIQKIITLEGKDILKKLEGQCILLDLAGKEQTSEEFACSLEKIGLTNSTITFIIGGSYGVSDEVKNKVFQKLSFGKMTFPHNLARIMLLEQIYRAFTITNNLHYHK